MFNRLENLALTRRLRFIVYSAPVWAIMTLPLKAVASEATSGGGSLPWDNTMTTLVNDISGPWAYAVSFFGMVAAGCGLVFGGELQEWLKRVLYGVLAICLIVFAKSILSSTLFSGALIPSVVSFIG